jgi:hypothetical protein
MRRIVLTAVALVVAGCASNPNSRLETTTPTLSPTQVAELQKNSKFPAELGFQVVVTENVAGFNGVNLIDAHEDVTVPLVEMPADHPYEPGGQYRAPVILASVNGHDGVRVMIDSGSNRNLFGYTLAQSLGIPLIAGLKPVTGYGIGGSVEDYIALVPTMRIGSIEFQKMVVVVGADAQVLSFTRGRNVQMMLLGVNALRQLSYLTIDNLHGKMIFGAHEPYLPDDTLKFLTTAPLHWLGDLPAVDISIDGREAVNCILDTGGDYGMILPRTRAIELVYWKPGKGEVTVPGGVAGASLAASYEIREAKNGDAMFSRVAGRTGLVGPDIGGGQAVFLGNGVLRSYRVTFDFQRHTLWLEK